MKKATRSKALSLSSGSCVMLGVLGLASAPVLLGFMLLYWLKLGSWPDWSLAAVGVLPPTTQYLGINKILQWIYDCEFAGLSFGGGLLLLWMGLWLLEIGESPTDPPAP